VIDCAILRRADWAAKHHRRRRQQGCDPHERGSAGCARMSRSSLIFSRVAKDGYLATLHARSSRRANEAVRKLYDTVWRGRKSGLRNPRQVKTSEVHKSIQKFFVQQGYKTAAHGRWRILSRHRSRAGLEIHEAPRVSPSSTEVLRPGHVVTVEPDSTIPTSAASGWNDVITTANGAIKI